MAMGIAIDYTITIGNIAEVGFILAGSLVAYGALKTTVKSIREEVTTMQEELKAFGQAIIQIAVQKNRLDNIEEDIRDMRRGRGFIIEERDADPRKTLEGKY